METSLVEVLDTLILGEFLVERRHRSLLEELPGGQQKLSEVNVVLNVAHKEAAPVRDYYYRHGLGDFTVLPSWRHVVW